ncbi:MAG TPA: alpha/beta fold hydrolase [Candidatus Binatia bacterium]|nr:alpha/beta fold hydrolase [Candidatus Binatia bacterium]
MEPIHFGPANRLFGLRCEPTATPRRTALLICHPWGVEYMRCYRALHLLARELAARGIENLRFDYTGTGDSGDADGGDASLDDWLEDIRHAAQELRTLAGAERIAILGLRLGALLATRAVDAGLRAEHLILWDPPASGRVWIEELQALDREHYARKNRYLPAALQLHSRPDELLGLPCPIGLQEAIAPLAATPAGDAARLISLLSPDVAAVAVTGEQVRLPDASHWTDIEWVTRPWTPAATPRVVCETLAERLQ